MSKAKGRKTLTCHELRTPEEPLTLGHNPAGPGESDPRYPAFSVQHDFSCTPTGKMEVQASETCAVIVD